MGADFQGSLLDAFEDPALGPLDGLVRTDLGRGGDARDGERGEKERVGDQLNGNLCRCTGYRAIRDAMLDALAEKRTLEKGRREPDLFQLRLSKTALPIR